MFQPAGENSGRHSALCMFHVKMSTELYPEYIIIIVFVIIIMMIMIITITAILYNISQYLLESSSTDRKSVV